MLKKLVLAAVLCVFSSAAFAQGNPQCPTRPNGDDTNACASTAFVQQALPTVPTSANPTAEVSGTAVNGSAATWMRSDAAPALANTAVTTGTYGDATHVGQFTVDQQGRLTGASSVPINIPTGTVLQPGGRITLVSGQPVMNADISSQNLYYAPFTGDSVPLYNGSTWSNYQFTSSSTDQIGLTLALGGSANWPAGTIFDVFAILNGGVPVLATRQWDSSMLPTYTQISSPSNTIITTGSNTTTWTRASAAFDGTLAKTVSASAITNSNSTNDMDNCLGQDMGSGNSYTLTKVALTEPTDSSFRGDDPTTIPTDIFGSNDNVNWQRLDVNRNIISTAATYGHTYTYYINNIDTTKYRYFVVCMTGATSTSSNLHFAQIQFFTTTPPSTRRLQFYNGIPTNDASMTARISATSTVAVPANEGTYLGSIKTDAGTAGQITADFGYGINRVMDIWNFFNRKQITLIAGIPNLSSGLPTAMVNKYNLTWPTAQDWIGVQSGTDYSVQVLVGYTGDSVNASFSRAWYIQGTSPSSYEFGIGIDATNSLSGSEGALTGDTTGGTALGYDGIAKATIPPFFGSHTLYGIEKLTYNPSGTVTAFDNIGNTGLYVTTQY
jgi:hypothetical protein